MADEVEFRARLKPLLREILTNSRPNLRFPPQKMARAYLQKLEAQDSH